MTEEQEKKSRKIALITSLGVHGVILLLLLLIVAWRTPNPPLPEYGIELNFGMATEGSGRVQPETPVGSEESEAEEVVEEIPLPEPEEITEEEVVEEAQPTETPSEQPEVVSKVESPVVVEEKKEVKPIQKPVETKEDPEPQPVKPEPKKEIKKEEVPLAQYPKKKSTASERPGTPSSQGDDLNKPGDKGNPEGELRPGSTYPGKPGGGGGGVSMSGFGAFGHPEINTPELPNNSNGIYEFRVKVDAEGYVISVTTVQRGLSYEAERRLKATIQGLRFLPQGNPQPADGTIRFNVRSE